MKFSDRGSKQSKSYDRFSKNLFGKLEEIAQNQNQNLQYDTFLDQKIIFPEQQNQHIHYNLIKKAKDLTQKNHQKIESAKLKLITKPKGQNTFLTGVQIYQEKKPEPVKQQQQQIPTENILTQIRTLRPIDDLEELRKMIKDTNNKLNNYGKDLSKTKFHVYEAAQKIGKQVHQGITFKIEKYAQFLPKINLRESMDKKTKLNGSASKKRY